MNNAKINSLKKFFNRKDVNTNRQVEVDIAKFMCMMGMVFVHSFGTAQAGFSNYLGLHFVIANFLSYTIGAVIYMFSMGVGIAYSRRSNSRYMFIRGVCLYFAGYVLEFIKGGLINLAEGVFFDPAYLADWYIDCFAVDVFHFAGLFFIVYAIFKKLKIKDIYFLILSIVLGILGSFFNNLNFNNFLINHFVGLFFGTFDPSVSFETHSYFPFCNWCLIPALGIFFGRILRKCKDKNKLYSRVSVLGFLIFIAYTVVCLPKNMGIYNYIQNGFYHHSIIGSVVNVSACLMMFGIYFVAAKILPQGVIKFMTVISKNVSFFYVIHLILIKWLWIIPSDIFGIYYFDDAQVMLFGLGILLLTIALTLLWNWLKNLKK